MKTAQEKIEIKKAAELTFKSIKNVAKIAEVVETQIRKYKAENHVSKKGKVLVGLPSRNIGINKFIIDNHHVKPDVAFEVVRLIGERTGKFAVGYAPFGSLLYLPEDYKGNAGTDFASLL